MSEFRELLLGCGHRREKDIITSNGREWQNLTTLDYYEESGADMIFDLCKLNATERGRMPFDDNTFDEIHAYDVLEHIHQQGDYESFFYEFGEYFRILKPNGFLCATVPAANIHVWGDPGHRRVINGLTLVYLSRDEVTKQLGKTTITDYRRYAPDLDFRLIFQTPDLDDRSRPHDRLGFVLQALKAA